MTSSDFEEIGTFRISGSGKSIVLLIQHQLYYVNLYDAHRAIHNPNLVVKIVRIRPKLMAHAR